MLVARVSDQKRKDTATEISDKNQDKVYVEQGAINRGGVLWEDGN